LSDLEVEAVTYGIPHLVWMADALGAAEYFDSSALEFTGMPLADMLGEGWLRLVHPHDVQAVAADWAAAVASGEPYQAEYRVRDRQGTYRRMQDRARPVRELGGVVRWIGTWTDIEPDRLLRDRLERAESTASAALALADAFEASAPIAFGFIDTEFRLLRFNDTMARLNGLSLARDKGRTVAEVAPDLWTEFAPRYRAVLETGEEITAVETVRPPGHDGPASVWYSKYFPVRVDAVIVGIGIVGVDVTEARQAERFRSVVMDTMAEGLYAMDANGRITFVNRSASALLGWSEDDLRGRLAHEAIHYLRADGSTFPEQECPLLTVRTEGRTIRISDDAFLRRDGTLLPVAYSASPLQEGSGPIEGVVVVFRDSAAESAPRQRAQKELDALLWLGRVRDAIDEDRLVLYAQPILGLQGGCASEELLVRLIMPSGEVVPPGMFLPVAERFGLIADVDRWVVKQAIQRAAAGHRVEVNISAWTMANVDLVPLVEHLLLESGANPDDVVFEITETALMHDLEAGRRFAHGLRALGCGLALDDFGTGFASFTYLKTMPFSYLKIDIEFVRDLADNQANRHVVEAIVSLARGFGQQTIAEGVEDERALDVLRECGVDFAQGYHLGAPAPL
jgi:PAS domain S-box-containing protein